jgi:hypothetical protein
MALVLADRVKETATGTSGDMALTGAVSGFIAFDADATFDGNTTYYTLVDADGTKWEVGLGTLSADSTTLTRTTILATQISFTDTTRQTFSGGTHTVFCTYPAPKSVHLDASGNLSHTVDISSDTNLAGGTGITLTDDTLSTTDSEIVHDNLSGFVANEHLDWTASVGTIHADNYTGGASDIDDLGDVSYGGTNLTNTLLINAIPGSAPTHGTLGSDCQYNIGIGNLCLSAMTDGVQNVAIGAFALTTLEDADYNVAIGYESFKQLTTGDTNIGIGWKVAAHPSNSITGESNIGIGREALYSLSAGSSNTALGYRGLYSVTSTHYNIGIGYNAGLAHTGSDTLFIANDDEASDGTLIKGDMANKHIAVGKGDSLVNAASSPTFQVYPNEAADEAIYAKMAANHTANLIEIENSSGSDLFVVNSAGELSTGAVNLNHYDSWVSSSGVKVGPSGIVMQDADLSHEITVKAPDVVSTSFTFPLPSGIGTNGQVLTSDSEQTYWSTVSGGGSMSDFIITDGSTPQTVDDGETITFADGVGAEFVTSATNTVTVNSVDSEIVHDDLSGFVTNEHINWTSSSAGTIHATNYTDTVYTLPEANATTKGGIELFSNTDQSVAATAVSATAARTYGLQLNSAGQGVVNIPWVDTNTTYSIGDGGLTTNDFTNADHTKLNGIEALADVTDAGNVTTAGALMDSEVTNLAFVKALAKGISDGNVLTANDAVADDDFLRINGEEVEGLTVAEVLTALNVEAGATADQSNAEIVAAVEAGTDSNTFTDADHTKLAGIATSANNYTLPSASTTVVGGVELATTGETTTGTDATRATTPAGVQAAIDALVGGAPGALDTLNELAAAINDDPSYASAITTALALKATLASPTFTGTVAIPNVANLETAVVANTAKVTNVSTNLATTTSTTTAIITSSDGTNATIPVATTSVGGVMSKAIFDQHTANVAKNTNVSTALSTGTVDATSYGITSDGGTDDVVLAQATTSFAGVLSAAKWDEIVANTAKSGNVSTDLSATANGTSLTVESSDGNNVALPAATTSAWGIMSDDQATKLDGIEASADVTDATNVTAAGALMDSELTDLAGVKGVTISTLQVKPSEGAFANGDKTKLDAIEASADITDTANVTSAGALMDSEVTNLADVKAFDTSDYATAAQGTKADSAQQPPTEGAFVDGDKTKLDAIEASATADQSNAEIVAAVEAGTDSNTFTDADHTKLDAIELLADVTDATNVTAAGALMDSELAGIAAVKATTGTFLTADQTKLDTIETSADVTDATNVTAAGALMDSELAGIAAVKATTGTFLTADQTKLDGIETSATADQTKSDIDGLAITTVGALSSGSITTGFGAIDTGSSTLGCGAITTTGDVIIGGATPTLTIGDAGAEDTSLVFDGNAQDFYIGLDDTDDDLKIGLGSAVGTTPVITMTGAGAVNFGVDDTGYDVKMYGATASSYLLWDESVNRLNLFGGCFRVEQMPPLNSGAEYNTTSGTAYANAMAVAMFDESVTDSTTYDIIIIDWELGNYAWLKLKDSVTKVVFKNMKRGGKYILRIEQADAGSKTVAWTNVDYNDSGGAFTEVRWVGGTAPSMTAASTATDVYGFLCTRSNGRGMDGYVIAQNMAEDSVH